MFRFIASKVSDEMYTGFDIAAAFIGLKYTKNLVGVFRCLDS